MLILYRIYQFLIMAPVLLVATVLTSVLTIIGCMLGMGRVCGYYLPMAWSRLFCWLTFVKVTVSGRENISKGQSYVFVANHQGAYDIFSVYGFLGHNFRWMMKKELENIPLVGYSCRVCGQVYVDTSTPAAIRETMDEAKKLLAKGMSVVVFPEGARTLDGKMHRFKRGAFVLAAEFGLPVVPITIDGSYDVLRRTATLPHWGHIKLTIHKPIYPVEGKHDLEKLMEESREAILTALPNHE